MLARISLVIDDFARVELLHLRKPHLEAPTDDALAVHLTLVAQKLSDRDAALAVVVDLHRRNVDGETDGLTPLARRAATAHAFKLDRLHDVRLAVAIGKLDALVAALDAGSKNAVEIAALYLDFLLVQDGLRRVRARLLGGILRKLALRLGRNRGFRRQSNRRELDVFGKLVMKLELDRAVALESDHGEDKTHVFAHVRRPSRAHVHENLRSGVTASQSHL